MLILAVMFYSCDKEEIVDIEEENISHVNEFTGNSYLRTTTTSNSDNDRPNSIDIEKQWLAYLVSQTLLADNDAKIYFANNHGNSIVIQVSDLFSHSDPQNPWANLFRKEFAVQYLSYYNGSSCLNQSRTEPSSRPPGKGPPPSNSEGDRLGSYLSSINNLEIYLPNSYNTHNSVIKSASDTATGYNEGFLHHGECNVENTSVNSVSNGNVIIARVKTNLTRN